MATQFAPAEVFHAAASGNVRWVREWLSGGGDANADVRPQDLKDARGRPMTAQWTEPDLHGDRYPIRPEFPKIVEKGLRLLAVAAWHGQCEVMRLLLAAGAEVNYFNRLNVLHHALMLAVANGQEDATGILWRTVQMSITTAPILSTSILLPKAPTIAIASLNQLL